MKLILIFGIISFVACSPIAFDEELLETNVSIEPVSFRKEADTTDNPFIGDECDEKDKIDEEEEDKDEEDGDDGEDGDDDDFKGRSGIDEEDGKDEGDEEGEEGDEDKYNENDEEDEEDEEDDDSKGRSETEALSSKLEDMVANEIEYMEFLTEQSRRQASEIEYMEYLTKQSRFAHLNFNAQLGPLGGFGLGAGLGSGQTGVGAGLQLGQLGLGASTGFRSHSIVVNGAAGLGDNYLDYSHHYSHQHHQPRHHQGYHYIA